MVKRKNNFIAKLINIILNILIGIFGVILLITIYNSIQTKILKNSYSSFFGYSVFEVQTGSMSDTINAGDWIIVKYQRSINLDDIITYEKNGEFITHRVVEVYKETYVTKGDSNNTKDDPINKEQVVGKVVKILPAFGILRLTIFNPAVLITLIITLYFANLVFKNKRKTTKESTNNDESVRGIEVVMEKLIRRIKDLIIKKLSKESEEETARINRDIISEETSIYHKDTEPLKIESKEEKETIEPSKEKTEQPPEDLEKTMYFRMVSVDQDEIDNIYQAPSNKHRNSDESISKLVDEKPTRSSRTKKTTTSKNTEKTTSKLEKEEDNEKTELELLQKRKKKFKNILEKVMYIKSEEISEIIDILNQREKYKTNEITIKKNFLNAYIDGKYYNYCGDVNVEYNGKNMTSKMSSVISLIAEEMIKNYKQTDPKFAEKVRKYETMFTLALYLEQAFLTDEDLDQKKESYKNKIYRYIGHNIYTDSMLKSIIQDIIKTQKKYNGVIKYSFEKLDTNIFELNFDNAISKTKKIYAVELEHNIAFSKVYSDYIVDKTYNEGIVAEDKLTVLLTLLLRQITKDMLNANFNKKYLLYIPKTLYEKEKKLYNIFKQFEDEYAKHSIVILIKYQELSKYSKIIRALIKEGYHFAIDLENIEKVKVKDRGCVELMDYILMTRKNKERENILASLSSDINTKVVYTDMLNKLGSIWGE